MDDRRLRAEHPDRVAAMVMADTPGGIFTPEMKFDRPREPLPVDASPPIGSLPTYAADYFARRPEMAFLYDEVRIHGARPPADAGARIIGLRYDLAAVKQRLTMPILCMVGEAGHSDHARHRQGARGGAAKLAPAHGARLRPFDLFRKRRRLQSTAARFHSRDRLREIIILIWFPFHQGKGLGVRWLLSQYTLLVIFLRSLARELVQAKNPALEPTPTSTDKWRGSLSQRPSKHRRHRDERARTFPRKTD